MKNQVERKSGRDENWARPYGAADCSNIRVYEGCYGAMDERRDPDRGIFLRNGRDGLHELKC